MLQRLYVNNFRCLENFELLLGGRASTLIIGENGSGKSSIAMALTVLQRIGRGVSRVGQLIGESDLAHVGKDLPARFIIEATLGGQLFRYEIAFEFQENLRELRVVDENLAVDGAALYSRRLAQVDAAQTGAAAGFMVDWHMVALPVILARADSDPLQVFKTWLARMVILAPIPSLMTGNSKGDDTLEVERDGANFGDWCSCLLSLYPAAYSSIADYLKNVGGMHDFGRFMSRVSSSQPKRLLVEFVAEGAKRAIFFNDLSDGEKCFFLCAVVLAANEHAGPLFCFWDEPDNFLSLSEVGYFIIELRKAFQARGQILVTSHHEETIRKFSAEDTLVLERKGHFEPTMMRRLDQIKVEGDLVKALIRGDLAL